ncbi:PREDICTED: general odorant-binding protein 56d-like [Drosophila arizonae]|uniref:General odorant-binding protein 56d-like n=1 Tax=Drosophila arizonae TaxID=7263 RepID=A0ABM1PC06_DROAR|nr:PREDICTED: general odorant-binding protein 56d-like [Drosophila arizonae]
MSQTRIRLGLRPRTLEPVTSTSYKEQTEGNTKEQAIALRNGNFEDADDKVKCYANCFLERAGFIVEGQINGDAVLQKLAPAAGADQVKAALATCASIKGANKCDTGFQIYRCFYRNRAWA